MKQSHIDWCPLIPDHWEEKRIKDIAFLQSGSSITAMDIAEEGPYPVYGGNGMRGYTNRFTNEGDHVLIGRQGALCGNINYAHGKFYATEHAVVMYTHNDEITYWLGETLRAANLNRLSMTAAQPGLAVSTLNLQFIPYPPREERIRIANYLKAKLTDIDSQITLLTSKRDAYLRLKKSIINHAVTKGLNPEVKMKASCVDWIGVIPEHWDIGRVKDYSNIIAGQAPSGEDIKEYGTIPFMQGKAEFTNIYPITKLFCETCTKHSRVGDILMSVRAPIGDVNISDNIYGIGRGLCAIKAININVTYLWYYLKNSKDYINSLGTGSTFLAITADDIKGIPIPILSFEEQQAIATYLDEKCSKIDKIVANLEKQISLYTDMKRSLIDEVITGKRAV